MFWATVGAFILCLIIATILSRMADGFEGSLSKAIFLLMSAFFILVGSLNLVAQIFLITKDVFRAVGWI